MVDLWDVVPWALPDMPRQRSRRTNAELRAQLREARRELMANVLWMAPREGPPDENLQGETVLDYIHRGYYDHEDVVEALLRAILYHLRDYHDVLLPWRDPIRVVLADHLQALYTPEHVAQSVLEICQVVLESPPDQYDRGVAISVFAAHMFLRYIRRGHSFSLRSYDPVRFQDDYFQDQGLATVDE